MPQETVYKPSQPQKGAFQYATSVKDVNLSVFSLNSQQLGGQGGAVDTTLTLYTVPSDHTFFITNVNLQVIKYTAAAGAHGRGKLYLNEQVVMRIYSSFTESESTAQSLSLNPPFILRSGETIKVESESANGLSQAGYIGFLVKNSDIRY